MDAFPDKTFKGEVIKIAALPDQQRNWLSPDIKVYTTQVSIEGTHSFLKPGMSARVEVLVDEVADALIVPVQVVANRSGKKICFVANSGKATEREVKTGLFNDTYVQILDGLETGEEVLLNPPRITETKGEPAKQLAGDFQKSQRQEQLTLAQATENRPAMGDPNMGSRMPETQAMAADPPGPAGRSFDPNQTDEQSRGRMRQSRGRFARGEGFDPNQMDEQTRERMRQFREQFAQGGGFDPNQMDEQTRERMRQFRDRRREQGDGTTP